MIRVVIVYVCACVQLWLPIQFTEGVPCSSVVLLHLLPIVSKPKTKLLRQIKHTQNIRTYLYIPTHLHWYISHPLSPITLYPNWIRGPLFTPQGRPRGTSPLVQMYYHTIRTASPMDGPRAQQPRSSQSERLSGINGLICYFGLLEEI